MKVGGQWVGWGLGDSHEDVRELKAVMRRRFSYARSLADSPHYDQQMVAAVAEMQSRYQAAGRLPADKFTPGVLNYATRVAMGLVTRPASAPDRRPLLFTVPGTGAPWWVGPDADTARAVEDRYRWQPIGYPARPVPMGPSIRAGRDELYVQFVRHRTQVEEYGAALAGYSQGAIVIGETWQEDISPPSGRLHWAKPHIRKAVTFGNPMRQAGSAWPTANGTVPPRHHHGVTGTLMTDTPDWWRDYAHRGDIYTDTPPDESAENRLAIWQAIRDGSLVRGPDSFLRQVLEVTGAVRDGSRLAEITGMVKAMLDAIIFFGQGTRPHINYSPGDAITYLRS